MHGAKGLIQAKEERVERQIIMSGEIDMFKRKFRSIVSALAIAVAVVSLTGCGGDGAETPAAKPVHFSAALPGGSDVAGTSDMVPQASTELRHFEIYNNYRTMFEGTSKSLGNGLHGIAESEAQNPLITAGDGRFDDAYRGCSVRLMLMLE